jgi:glycerol transport system permease protein
MVADGRRAGVKCKASAPIPLAAAAGCLTIIPGAVVIYFVRNYIAKGFALGRV